MDLPSPVLRRPSRQAHCSFLATPLPPPASTTHAVNQPSLPLPSPTMCQIIIRRTFCPLGDAQHRERPRRTTRDVVTCCGRHPTRVGGLPELLRSSDDDRAHLGGVSSLPPPPQERLLDFFQNLFRIVSGMHTPTTIDRQGDACDPEGWFAAVLSRTRIWVESYHTSPFASDQLFKLQL